MSGTTGTWWPGLWWPIRALIHVATLSGYIMPSLTEIVRDQIGLIVSTELAKQKTIAEDLALNHPATPEGIQAQSDLDNDIFKIVNNIFIEKGTHFQAAQLPGMNIYFDAASSNAGTSKAMQITNSVYTLSAHFESAHVKKGDEAIDPGDEKSARNALRVIAIVRAILMSGPYVRLGFDDKPRIVNKRWVNSFDVLQPDFQESDGRHGNVAALKITVELEELGPQITGEVLQAIFTAIKIKLKTSDDGNIININTQ